MNDLERRVTDCSSATRRGARVTAPSPQLRRRVRGRQRARRAVGDRGRGHPGRVAGLRAIDRELALRHAGERPMGRVRDLQAHGDDRERADQQPERPVPDATRHARVRGNVRLRSRPLLELGPTIRGSRRRYAVRSSRTAARPWSWTVVAGEASTDPAGRCRSTLIAGRRRCRGPVRTAVHRDVRGRRLRRLDRRWPGSGRGSRACPRLPGRGLRRRDWLRTTERRTWSRGVRAPRARGGSRWRRVSGTRRPESRPARDPDGRHRLRDRRARWAVGRRRIRLRRGHEAAASGARLEGGGPRSTPTALRFRGAAFAST